MSAGNILGTSIIQLLLDRTDYDRQVEQVEQDTEKSTSRLGSAFGKIGSVAAVGVGAAGTALAGFTAKGITDFIGFQSQMNEVFTLLPGISDKAMGDMTTQVKDFSKQFGVLPEEEIPALYQAISAGVPKDNVFDFLTTAQKAAVGGVTDLQTSVDGISSVVNAYGSDVISATQASDLMFTAVKDGKTDFAQLSQSLFNVIPTASALGVGFGDVTASIAAMTAQGTPTSVATTQIRQMLVELSKAGSGAADTFQSLSGKSFKDFIASGGNLQDALNIMQQGADDAGVGISDLFSSVEAGNAALALTGKGAETFGNDLKDMQNSAGATDKAYATMDKGIGQTLNKLRANFKVALLDIGQQFAPTIEKVGNKLIEWMPTISSFVESAITEIGVIIGVVTNAFETAWPYITEFATLLADVFAGDIFPVAVAAVSGLQAAWEAISPSLQTVAGFIGDNIKPILVGVAVALTTIVVPAIVAWGVATVAAAASTVIALAPILIPIAAIGAAAALLYKAWTSDWGGIQEKVSAVWAVVKPVFDNIVGRLEDFWKVILPKLSKIWDETVEGVKIDLKVMSTIISTVFGAVAGFVEKYHKQIGDIFERYWTIIKTTVDVTIHIISDIIQVVLSLISGDWSGAWGAIKDIGNQLWTEISTLGQNLFGIFRDELGIIWDAISTKVSTIWDGIETYLGDKVTTIKGAITGAISLVRDTLSGIWAEITKTVSDTWDGIEKLLDTGKQAIYDALMWPFNTVKDNIGPIIKGFVNEIIRPVNALLSGWSSLVSGIKGAINWISNKLGLGDLVSGTWTAPQIAELYTGARNFQGGMAIVGEKGPELVNLPPGSDVYSASQTAHMGAGGLGDIVGGVVDAVTSVASSVASTVKDWLAKGASWVVDQALSALNITMPGIFATIPSALISMLKPEITNLVQDLLNGLNDKINQAASQAPVSGSSSGTYTGDNAVVNEAFNHLGELYSNNYDGNGNHLWDMWCEAFVEAVDQHVGYARHYYGSAKAHASAIPLHTGPAPAGSSAFWDWQDVGHTAISIGDGSYIGTSSNGIQVQNPALNFLGWAAPGVANGGFFQGDRPRPVWIGEGNNDEIVSPVPILEKLLHSQMIQSLQEIFGQNFQAGQQGDLHIHLDGPITVKSAEDATLVGRQLATSISQELRRRGLR